MCERMNVKSKPQKKKKQKNKNQTAKKRLKVKRVWVCGGVKVGGMIGMRRNFLSFFLPVLKTSN